MTALYEIAENLRQAFDNIAIDENGEVQGLSDLDELGVAFGDKAEATACYIKELIGLAERIKAEEKAFAERRRQLENKTEWLKKYLSRQMQTAGRPELETPRCRISFRKSEAVVADIEMLPREFVRMEIRESADKAAIKAALKAGREVTGAALVQSNNIQIR